MSSIRLIHEEIGGQKDEIGFGSIVEMTSGKDVGFIDPESLTSGSLWSGFPLFSFIAFCSGSTIFSIGSGSTVFPVLAGGPLKGGDMDGIRPCAGKIPVKIAGIGITETESVFRIFGPFGKRSDHSRLHDSAIDSVRDRLPGGGFSVFAMSNSLVFVNMNHKCGVCFLPIHGIFIDQGSADERFQLCFFNESGIRRFRRFSAFGINNRGCCDADPEIDLLDPVCIISPEFEISGKILFSINGGEKGCCVCIELNADDSFGKAAFVNLVIECAAHDFR